MDPIWTDVLQSSRGASPVEPAVSRAVDAICRCSLVVGVRHNGPEAVHFLLAVKLAAKLVDDGDEPVAGLPAARAIACSPERLRLVTTTMRCDKPVAGLSIAVACSQEDPNTSVQIASCWHLQPCLPCIIIFCMLSTLTAQVQRLRIYSRAQNLCWPGPAALLWALHLKQQGACIEPGHYSVPLDCTACHMLWSQESKAVYLGGSGSQRWCQAWSTEPALRLHRRTR